jgi:transcriptional regulator with XRE-family HTH domain
VKITELKKMREEKGLTQEMLAQQSKKSLRAYKYYESGERLPDVHTAIRIADRLGVTDLRELFPAEEQR